VFPSCGRYGSDESGIAHGLCFILTSLYMVHLCRATFHEAVFGKNIAVMISVQNHQTRK